MNKPEWFELAEKDGGKTHFEVKRGLRSFLLAIPLLAISVGVVAAQTSNESPAIAETETLAIASAAPSITSNVAQAKPSIATPMLPPTYVDDDEDDDHGDDHDDDENEEEDDD
jgi:hypothetical protein